MKRITNLDYIDRCILKHDNIYDYSRTEYKTCDEKVIIGCPTHGWFKQNAANHLYGKGCLQCKGANISKSKKSNLSKYLKKAILVHGDLYDYSKTVYKGSSIKIDIICRIHGRFKQTPNNHLSGKGCDKCANKNVTNEEYIKKANKIHNNLYSYKKLEYISCKYEIIIGCPTHGWFKQLPNNHLKGHGCSKCGGVYQRTPDDYLKEARSVYGGKYDLSKTVFKNSKTDIVVVCKSHGEFNKNPRDFLTGYGCPKCRNISKGETEVRLYLEKNNIDYLLEHKFDGLANKHPLRFDFFLPNHNMCIEYDGIQHYEAVEYFGGETSFTKTLYRDGLKNQYCIDNNIDLLRIPYTDYNNIENIIKKELNI